MLEKNRIKKSEKNFWDFSYQYKGYYTEHLKRFYNYFGKDQILVLFSENFYNHPGQELKKILKFIKVDEDFNFEIISSTKQNKTRYPRISFLMRILNKDPLHNLLVNKVVINKDRIGLLLKIDSKIHGIIYKYVTI